jgi:Creatinase/Prolidase N-terminal domain/Metallopeptidase family M24
MSGEWGVALREIALPEFELPRQQPVIPAATYQRRLEDVYAAMSERSLDAVVVYGDREHFANLSYLTGFDPRWEESLLILVPGGTPRLVVGNENVAWARVVPYEIEVVRLPKFSLIGQPDPGDVALSDVLRDAGIAAPAVRRVGLIGWKFWTGPDTARWIDLPHFIVQEVAVLVDSVTNATDMLMSPDGGLRLYNDVDQIAAFEFAGTHASEAVRRLLHGVRAGMTELEASQLMQPILLPFSYHPTMLSGPNAAYGVASASDRVLQVGDPVCTGLGYWGGNTARAGFLVEDASQLPDAAADYLQKLAEPYYATAAAWYETIRIGLTAGELYDVTFSRIGDPFYGVYLNPGHFIHLDEWPSSPVSPSSPVVFTSGNALQLDIIPITGSAYHTAQIEDGVVLADSDLRLKIAALYPDVWSRIQQRRSMVTKTFGIELHDEVLPLSNAAAYFPPFWLAPQLAMVRL